MANFDSTDLERNHNRLLKLLEKEDPSYMDIYDEAVKNYHSVKMQSDWGTRNPFQELPEDIPILNLKSEKEFDDWMKYYKEECHKMKQTRREFEDFLKTQDKKDSKDEKTQVDPEINDMLRVLVSKELKGVNLARINVPTFNGDPKNWIMYKDIIDVMIKDRSCNPVRKLLCLKQSTTGSAHRIIRNIRSGEDAHLKAYKMLIDRYDNIRTIMNTELYNLFSKEKKPELAKNVKFLLETSLSFVFNLENIIRENEESLALVEKREKLTFTNSQIKEKLADIFFLHAIKSRFGATLSLSFEEYVEKLQLKHITIENLIDFLEKQHRKMEFSMASYEKHSDEKLVQNMTKNSQEQPE